MIGRKASPKYMDRSLDHDKTEHQAYRRAKPKYEDESKLGFGRLFTDHMFMMDYDVGQGWHDARIVHTRTSCSTPPRWSPLRTGHLRGLKAYRNERERCSCSGRGTTFSAEQLRRPAVYPAHRRGPGAGEPARADPRRAGWIPSSPGTSLYIRRPS